MLFFHKVHRKTHQPFSLIFFFCENKNSMVWTVHYFVCMCRCVLMSFNFHMNINLIQKLWKCICNTLKLKINVPFVYKLKNDSTLVKYYFKIDLLIVILFVYTDFIRFRFIKLSLDLCSCLRFYFISFLCF